jgi:hypothetical protein
MSEILKRLKAAREFDFPVPDVAPGCVLRLRALTALELQITAAAAQHDFEIVLASVVGWSGLPESVLITSGSSDPVGYTPELARAWLGDRSDLWPLLFKAVGDRMTAARAQQEALAKN